MTEFKFNCPTCGQHILAATKWSGRRINCPSCETKITIPPPPKTQEKSAQAKTPDPRIPAPKTPVAKMAAPESSVPKPAPKTTGDPVRVVVPAQGAKPPSGPTPASPALAKSPQVKNPTGDGADLNSKPAPVTARKRPQIAVLTLAIKLDMIHAVRRRIAKESAWMPGLCKGAKAYAGKNSGGEIIPVDVKSPEATRFSLLGAFLLEFHERNVTRTATGRTKLLDREIPEAVHAALKGGVVVKDAEPTASAVDKDKVLSISHAQCLATLDVLEQRFSEGVEMAKVEQARQSLGNIRLPELVRKLEKKARIVPADVATALYHELTEVRRRLDRLESAVAGDK